MVVLSLLVAGTQAWGQVDKRDVRRGNRDFKKENFREADIDYRKALVKDSLSVAANYNLANNLYRQKDMEQAKATLERIGEIAPEMEQASDYYYNLGDVAIAQQDWQGTTIRIRTRIRTMIRTMIRTTRTMIRRIRMIRNGIRIKIISRSLSRIRVSSLR